MSNLYDRYKRWLKISKDSLAEAGFDDAALDAAAFNAQQAMEFLLKYIMDCKNVPYHKTHNIRELLVGLRDSGFSFDNMDAAMREADRITSWEAGSRYGSGATTVKGLIEDSYKIIESIDTAWIEENKPTNKKKSVSDLLKDVEG